MSPFRSAMITMIVCAAICLITIGLVVVLSDQSTKNTQQEICRAIVVNNDILHDLLTDAEEKTAEEYPKKADQVEKFYQPTIDRINHIQC